MQLALHSVQQKEIEEMTCFVLWSLCPSMPIYSQVSLTATLLTVEKRSQRLTMSAPPHIRDLFGSDQEIDEQLHEVTY